MYRCDICRASSQPKQAALKHATYRPNKQIRKEYKICRDCNEALSYGATVDDIKEQLRESPAVAKKLRAVTV